MDAFVKMRHILVANAQILHRLDRLDRKQLENEQNFVKVFRNSHDRFLIIDDSIYHFGASIKDLGKKWFAVNLMTEYSSEELLRRL